MWTTAAPREPPSEIAPPSPTSTATSTVSTMAAIQRSRRVRSVTNPTTAVISASRRARRPPQLCTSTHVSLYGPPFPTGTNNPAHGPCRRMTSEVRPANELNRAGAGRAAVAASPDRAVVGAPRS